MIRLEVIRSSRKSLAIELRPGCILVRAPRQISDREIRRFVESRRDWIETHMEKALLRQEQLDALPRLTEAELRALKERAKQVIPQRAAFYAPLAGVRYGTVTIRSQRTRWGSCTAAGNLSFNCLLMLAPPEVLDSVVVHELCHRLEMNHSDRFYAQVLRVFPEYHRWHRWLKDNGPALMARLPQEA